MLQLGPDLFERLNAKQWVGNQQPMIFGKGGLSILEIQLVEAKLGFPIPKDFAYLLQNVRDPGGVLFPWATFKKQQYDDKIQWVLGGIEFSVEVNGLWLKRWGDRPATLSDALEIVRHDFETWPKLLPIYGHRFLAAEPLRDDNPVFSIMGTDIIYYGSNLAHYLLQEFMERGSDHYADNVREIDIKHVNIWSDFVHGRADFLSFSDNRILVAKLADAVRGLTGAQTHMPPAIKLEVQANGDVRIEGKSFTPGEAFEIKLREFADREPRPMLQLTQSEPEIEDLRREYEALLAKNGYRTFGFQVKDEDGGIHWENLSTWFIPLNRS